MLLGSLCVSARSPACHRCLGYVAKLTQCVLEAPRHEDLAQVPLLFSGRNAAALHALLQRQKESPIDVFLSGYGAETQRFGTSEAPRARVVYAQSRVALKALLRDEQEYTVWFDCNKDAPVTQVMHPVVRRPSPAPSDAWLNTPALRRIDPTPQGSAPTLQFTPASTPAPSMPPPSMPPSIPLSMPPPAPAAEQALNGHVYTPIQKVKSGTVANVMGVAVVDATVRPPAQRSRDVMVKLAISDGSGPDVASSTLSSNLFASEEGALPGAVAEHDAVLLRGVQIGLFNGRPQGVASRKHPFQWAAWSASTQTWRYASSARPSDFGDAERTALLQLVGHLGTAPPAPSANARSITTGGSTRALTTLDTLQPHTFVDTVVEIVKVFAQSATPDLYITDYTAHRHIYDGNNKHLSVQPPGPGGCVLQVGLFESHAPLAVQLRPGQLVRLDNVRIRENPSTGLLTGALGSANDRRIRISPVDQDHAAVRALKSRKAAWANPGPAEPRKRPAPATPTPARRRPAPDAVRAPRYEIDDDPFAEIDVPLSPSP